MQATTKALQDREDCENEAFRAELQRRENEALQAELQRRDEEQAQQKPRKMPFWRKVCLVILVVAVVSGIAAIGIALTGGDNNDGQIATVDTPPEATSDPTAQAITLAPVDNATPSPIMHQCISRSPCGWSMRHGFPASRCRNERVPDA
ncbi:unnamed protein product [Cylindrotheca closterium]|uniref:Uncharacterized protein n=1 Tax=Cylindrotheca closterium TaxID=2856 RepID=A0AAD2G960_9STRA|nr:unnamed protein product [Cylindrotheca closterium]